MNALMSKVVAFVRDEKGVVMTEYLVLLALLVGGTLLAVTTTGQNISNTWNAWGSYFLELASKAV